MSAMVRNEHEQIKLQTFGDFVVHDGQMKKKNARGLVAN
jgi:hypothetical protein